MFYRKDTVDFHRICNHCNNYLGKFACSDQVIKCPLCQNEINVKDVENKDFFVTLDPTSQIAEILKSNWDYYTNVVNDRIHDKNCIKDIYDGKCYRKFVSQLSKKDRNKYATVTFNTDGAPLFCSSSYSIWPIFLMVNELPMKIRCKEVILVGLWFGKNKPNMSIFLHPFVENMNKLSINGIKLTVDGVEKNIKIFPLVCCVDSVARPQIQGFSQYNGKFGCNLCLHPGQWVPNKTNTGGCLKFPVIDPPPLERNKKETIKHGHFRKKNFGKPVSGKFGYYFIVCQF